MGSSKRRRDVEVEVDSSAKNLAQEWIRGMGAVGDDMDDDNEDDIAKDAPRPARLGLGAKFIPHNKALHIDKEAESRLAKKLKKIKKDEDEKLQRAPVRSEEENDEVESRTGAFKQKVKPKEATAELFSGGEIGEKKKKKKKKKKEIRSIQEAGIHSAGGQEVEAVKGEHGKGGSEEAVGAHVQAARRARASEPSKGQSKSGAKEIRTVSAVGGKSEGEGEDVGEAISKHTQVKKGNFGGQKGGDEDGAEDGVRRQPGDAVWEERQPRRKRIKGKKTRSRQKNLRKDTRPAHLKPGYVDPNA